MLQGVKKKRKKKRLDPNSNSALIFRSLLNMQIIFTYLESVIYKLSEKENIKFGLEMTELRLL